MFLSQGTCRQHSLSCDWRVRSSVPRGFLHFISHGPIHNMAVCAFRANGKSLFNLLKWTFIQRNTFRDAIISSVSPYSTCEKQIRFTCTQVEVMTQRFGFQEQECWVPIENSVYHRYFTMVFTVSSS